MAAQTHYLYSQFCPIWHSFDNRQKSSATFELFVLTQISTKMLTLRLKENMLCLFFYFTVSLYVIPVLILLLYETTKIIQYIHIHRDTHIIQPYVPWSANTSSLLSLLPYESQLANRTSCPNHISCIPYNTYSYLVTYVFY